MWNSDRLNEPTLRGGRWEKRGRTHSPSPALHTRRTWHDAAQTLQGVLRLTHCVQQSPDPHNRSFKRTRTNLHMIFICVPFRYPPHPPPTSDDGRGGGPPLTYLYQYTSINITNISDWLLFLTGPGCNLHIHRGELIMAVAAFPVRAQLLCILISPLETHI